MKKFFFIISKKFKKIESFRTISQKQIFTIFQSFRTVLMNLVFFSQTLKHTHIDGQDIQKQTRRYLKLQKFRERNEIKSDSIYL